MAVIGELLFYPRRQGPTLSDKLNATQSQGMQREVDNLKPDAFQNETDEKLANRIFEKCVVTPLSLNLSESKGDVVEITYKGKNSWDEYVEEKGMKVTKTIPFEGEKALFELQPDTYDLNPPRGEIRGNILIIGMEVPDSQTEKAARYIEDTVAAVVEYIERQSHAISKHNAALPNLANARIAERRARLTKASDLADRLGSR
jgi:hypothetical protein